MIFAVAAAALSAVGLQASTVGSIVLYGNDQMNGRVISCMVGAGPAGGVDRDVTMIASSGEHAFIYAYLRLLAGQDQNVLLVGWGKPSEGVSPEHAQLVSAEPYLLRRVGMNDTIAAALQASRMTTTAATGRATAWPLTAADLPADNDVVYAAILAAEGSFEPETELAWVLGAGWAMDGYDMGTRDVAEMPALAAALQQIEKRGVPGAARWSIVEIAAPSEVATRAVVGKLGLRDDVRINAAGSTADFMSTSSTSGLGRFIAAVDALDSQPAGSISAGIGLQGFAGQGAAVMVFGGKGGNL
ncbi:hypothetical protein OG884_37155 [Streptosporangium sp. NBC_01755]|uniref:hypothetical protein n=1 Tax=unclassified Streptosporangium TaxID=2632669 RepID=UPI002DD8DECC|nr:MULTISPECIES: hypothetical protein [unclassified Streptosporangium]WSA28197.1 hypothetical protein OIE13_10180 [Streptosporangium sp. NBC_01810]WSD00326.1 hypothetical protein OG884_37155 [Streptosporangium sp. NBC_01755]